MAKYTINLPEAVEKDLREMFERDNLLWSKYPKSGTTKSFEEYIAWFVEDYIAEIKESEKD